MRATQLLLGLAVWLSVASGQVITTIAGTDWSFPAGSMPAVDAPLGGVAGLVLDPQGNIYFSDIDNHMVMRVSLDGVLTVVAGNGRAGFSGDGGPATSASLYSPVGLAFDFAGNLYVADAGTFRVRKVTAAGIITTVAGNGSDGHSGDGGPATAAALRFPSCVAVNTAGEFYFGSGTSIRKVSAAGIITTLVGGGQGDTGDGGPVTSASITIPNALAFDANGNLLVATADRVRRIGTDGMITRIAGGGEGFGDNTQATSVALTYPNGIATDNVGNIFFSELFNHRVRKVTAAGVITTVAGVLGLDGFAGDGGLATSARLNSPRGVAVDASGSLYIADQANKRIRKVGPGGTIGSIAGNGGFQFSGDGGLATAAALNLTSASGASLDSAGNLYFPDGFNHRVRRIAPDGSIATVAGNGFFAVFNSAGDGGPATNAQIYSPQNVAVDLAGNVYIAQLSGPVRKVTRDGVISPLPGPGAAALTVDGKGNLYAAGQYQIRRVAPDGTSIVLAGNNTPGNSGDGGRAVDASFILGGVAVDNAGSLYLSDVAFGHVRKVSPDGIISNFAGKGFGAGGDGGPAVEADLAAPFGLASDSRGNLYVADAANNRVRKISPDGIITTVAGNGGRGYSGDGGPATAAGLTFPTWILPDAAGNLYIGDTGNNRIRKVLAAKPSFSADRANLDFSAVAGGSRAGSQTVGLSGSVSGLAFSATASDPWITVTPDSGIMAVSVGVTVDPGQLAPGNYAGSIRITAPLADPAERIVPVSFSVADPNPPRLSVDPSSLALSLPQQSTPAQKSFFVANAGSGILTFNASASGTAAWLKVSVANNVARPASPGSIDVTADPTGLSAGSYSGSVVVTSATTNETANIPVTLTVTAVNRPGILLSQTGLSFRSVANACSSTTANCSEDLPQCFAVLNSGQGTLDFTVSADVPWLQIGRATCPYRAVSSPSSPPEVVALLRAGRLAAGSYEGHIQVTAPQADNSPQTVLVKLTVVSSSSSLGPIVRPTGLVFAAPAAQPPGSLDVYMYNLAQQSFHYASSSVFLEGGGWFSYAPSIGDVKASQDAGVLKVFPDFSRLPAGVYHGGITLATVYGLQPVEVLAALTGGSGASQSRRSATGCAPSALNGVFTLVQPEFDARIGQPFPVELYVSDDCGAPLTAGSVVASFSNGDAGLNLIPLQDGRWSGTWTPERTAAGNRVQITVHASASGTGVAGDLQRSGNLR